MYEISKDVKYDKWISRLNTLLGYQHNLHTDDFSDKYDFEVAYNDDRRPREVVTSLEKKFLDN
jgi:hypothetical protein